MYMFSKNYTKSRNVSTNASTFPPLSEKFSDRRTNVLTKATLRGYSFEFFFNQK